MAEKGFKKLQDMSDAEFEQHLESLIEKKKAEREKKIADAIKKIKAEEQKDENGVDFSAVDQSRDKRLRVWLAIIYPESIKENWQQLLSDACVKCAISPLHDADVWTSEDEAADPDHVAGECKKPHYHIVFVFNGVKSFRQVWDILKYISLDPDHAPPPKIPKGDISEAIEYLIHRNHPEKAQYPQSGIVTLNGMSIESYFRLNKEQEDYVADNLDALIRGTGLCEYYDLWSYLRSMRYVSNVYMDMWRYICQHTYITKSLCDSRRNSYDPHNAATAEIQHDSLKQKDPIYKNVRSDK